MPEPSTPFDFIDERHFSRLRDRDEAVRLFQQSVVMVEVEVFSYCNRVCWFCPNSIVDRRATRQYMPEATYLNVVDQLAALDYTGMVSYSRYNEPLSDRIILRRIEQARQRLPRALLHTNTNGDYLTRAYLDDLAAAGLGSLNIQIYLGNDDRYDHERMRAKLDETIDRLELVATPVADDAGLWLESSARHRDIRIRLYARNFEINGTDRGGTVPIQIGARRTSPCLSPFYHIYIDFNGSVMPCCNLRSDVPSHVDAVVATLGPTSDLVSIYAGEVMAGWRRSLVGFDVKAGHCRSCTFATHPETADNRRVQERLVACASATEAAA